LENSTKIYKFPFSDPKFPQTGEISENVATLLEIQAQIAIKINAEKSCLVLVNKIKYSLQ